MKRLIWTLPIVTVVLAGGAYYLNGDASADAPQVTVAPVTRGDIVVRVAATGTLAPVDTVEVGTQVSGTIASLGADFNQPVTRGQTIATLDPAVLTSQVTQAEATVIRLRAELERTSVLLDDARVKLTRAEQLAGRQLIAMQEVDTARSNARVAEVTVSAAKAQLDQAEAALQQARVNLSHTVIASPVAGIVLSRNVEVGQTVSAGLQAPTLFVIARSLDTLQLDARVDESDVGRVKPGQSVTFTVDAWPGDTFTGAVRQVRLQPTVTQNVVSYTTVIDVPNPRGQLKPGMTATLDIEVAREADVLRVPAAALRFTPADARLVATGEVPAANARRDTSVWVRTPAGLEPVRVTAGLSDNVSVAISGDGIAEGTEVVTAASIGGAAPAASSSTPASGSPLMPSFPRPRNAGTQRQAR
ncbi:MAG: efflux RND transporter periplasmic adaptor subunit [Acidobacteria bacterium]|nr:efflux RND transporter periplasmic adaptor subunit [Acidobacteriota bacterium]